MGRFKFLVSLSFNADKNDYQREMSVAAKEAGSRLGVDIQITFANNDSDAQSRSLLEAVNMPTSMRPDAIIVLPVGDGLREVADAAAKQGIGWAVLNRYADYVAQLRRLYSVPIFGVGIDQEEIGRIQGRQISALLPGGGTVLSVTGPNGNVAAAYRSVGMQSTKPINVPVRTLRGAWTEESGYNAVKEWLQLPASAMTRVALVAAQSDEMAMGARRAFEDLSTAKRFEVQTLPFLGVDGTVTAKGWMRSGQLTASVVVPVTVGVAVEIMAGALESGQRPDRNAAVAATSLPPLEQLRRVADTSGPLQW